MIDDVMAHFMKTIGITGASLALVRDEKLVYAKGFGKMAEGGEPVGPHTMFRIGEVSKAITSATIMTMFERGEFNVFFLFGAPPFFRLQNHFSRKVVAD